MLHMHGSRYLIFVQHEDEPVHKFSTSIKKMQLSTFTTATI